MKGNLVKGDRFSQKFKYTMYIFNLLTYTFHKKMCLSFSPGTFWEMSEVQIDYLGPSIHPLIAINRNLAANLIPSLCCFPPKLLNDPIFKSLGC